jgi:hypothetical protein
VGGQPESRRLVSNIDTMARRFFTADIFEENNRMANARPEKEIRLGRIKASVWSNESETANWFTVTVQRLYKDGEQWKTSDSFSRDDLPLLCKVIDQAHTWMFQQAGAHSSRERDDSDESHSNSALAV